MSPSRLLMATAFAILWADEYLLPAGHILAARLIIVPGVFVITFYCSIRLACFLQSKPSTTEKPSCSNPASRS